MNDHATIEELIAVRSLGGLDAGDLAHLEELMAAHGPACEECRRLREQYAEVAGRLAFAVAPDQIPAGMEDRLVHEAVRPSRRMVFGARRLVAAAAAAVLLVGAGIGGYLVAPRSSPSLQLATLRGSGSGTVALALRPGGSQSFLLASGLPDAPSGHVYELWFFRGDTPVPAATFTPDRGRAVVRVPSDASTARLAAITIERAPGAKKPHGAPIFSAPIRV